MKNATAISFAVLIIAVVGILAWARAASDPHESTARTWQGTDVACIMGHQNLAQHFHPRLAITVDGQNEPIPANIGIDESCMAEIHTHDASGELHIETVVFGKQFTIADFFAVWGRSMDREGHTYQMFVDGELADPATYVLADQDRIEMRYSSEGSLPVESSAFGQELEFDLDI